MRRSYSTTKPTGNTTPISSFSDRSVHWLDRGGALISHAQACPSIGADAEGLTVHSSVRPTTTARPQKTVKGRHCVKVTRATKDTGEARNVVLVT
jgi:hypothetical protein